MSSTITRSQNFDISYNTELMNELNLSDTIEEKEINTTYPTNVQIETPLNLFVFSCHGAEQSPNRNLYGTEHIKKSVNNNTNTFTDNIGLVGTFGQVSFFGDQLKKITRLTEQELVYTKNLLEGKFKKTPLIDYTHFHDATELFSGDCFITNENNVPVLNPMIFSIKKTDKETPEIEKWSGLFQCLVFPIKIKIPCIDGNSYEQIRYIITKIDQVYTIEKMVNDNLIKLEHSFTWNKILSIIRKHYSTITDKTIQSYKNIIRVFSCRRLGDKTVPNTNPQIVNKSNYYIPINRDKGTDMTTENMKLQIIH